MKLDDFTDTWLVYLPRDIKNIVEYHIQKDIFKEVNNELVAELANDMPGRDFEYYLETNQCTKYQKLLDKTIKNTIDYLNYSTTDLTTTLWKKRTIWYGLIHTYYNKLYRKHDTSERYLFAIDSYDMRGKEIYENFMIKHRIDILDLSSFAPDGHVPVSVLISPLREYSSLYNSIMKGLIILSYLELIQFNKLTFDLIVN